MAEKPKRKNDQKRKRRERNSTQVGLVGFGIGLVMGIVQLFVSSGMLISLNQWAAADPTNVTVKGWLWVTYFALFSAFTYPFVGFWRGLTQQPFDQDQLGRIFGFMWLVFLGLCSLSVIAGVLFR